MLQKLLCCLLTAALLLGAAQAENVFQGILSNQPLNLLRASAFQVEDDEDDPFGDDDLIPLSAARIPTTLTITVGGDAVVGIREIWWYRDEALPAYLTRFGMDYPFSGLSDLFSTDDLTFINLECTIKPDQTGEVTTKEYRFRGLPKYTQMLTAHSVDLLNIANNHYIDYGEAGEASTRQALEAAGLPYAGYGYAYIWQQQGWTIGFAGCRETEYKLDPTIIAREAAELRDLGCDVIIYSCHWGREYTTQHNADQLNMAQAAADAGVDIIVGTHPHVVQGLADVNGTVVLWSLGNLMFGGTINMQTFDATLARLALHFDRNGYTGCTVEFIPILTSSSAGSGVNDYHPIPATGDVRARILAKIQHDSSMDISVPVEFPARQGAQ